MCSALFNHLGRQRLAHEVRYANCFGPCFVRSRAKAGDDYDWGPRLTRLDMFSQFDAIHAGHLDVSEYEVVFLRAHFFQRFRSTLSGDAVSYYTSDAAD